MARSVIEQIEIAVKYAGYIDLQKTEVERASHYENLKLPADLDYLQVSALSSRQGKPWPNTGRKPWAWLRVSPVSRQPRCRCCWYT